MSKEEEVLEENTAEKERLEYLQGLVDGAEVPTEEQVKAYPTSSLLMMFSETPGAARVAAAHYQKLPEGKEKEIIEKMLQSYSLILQTVTKELDARIPARASLDEEPCTSES